MYLKLVVKLFLPAEYNSCAGCETAPKSHQWRGAGSQGGESRRCPSTIVGYYEHAVNDRSTARQGSVGVCHLVIHHTLPIILSGTLYCYVVLLSEWRSNYIKSCISCCFLFYTDWFSCQKVRAALLKSLSVYLSLRGRHDWAQRRQSMFSAAYNTAPETEQPPQCIANDNNAMPGLNQTSSAKSHEKSFRRWLTRCFRSQRKRGEQSPKIVGGYNNTLAHAAAPESVEFDLSEPINFAMH